MKKIVILSGWTGSEIEIAKKSANFFKKYIKREYDYYELPKQLDSFLENKDKYSLAIPVFHWEYGEDGRIFAFLNILGIAHTFSSYNTHALCLDKYKANTLVNDIWVKIPEQFIVFNKNNFETVPKELKFPIILKPNRWGSSFFTYKIDSYKELEEKLHEAKNEVDDDILLQEFISWEEYSVSIVNWKTLAIMKLEKQKIDDFFDYDAKYESEDKMKEIWPKIEKKLETKLIKYSQKLYQYFEIQWFCRVDYLVDWEDIYFLEINTIPGMTDASILPKSWLLTWKSFEELVDEIIK